MARDTGLPSADAQFDFNRARRRRALARLSSHGCAASRDDVNHILPFEEVVAALGRGGERGLGQQLIALDSIVGTVDRGREFDRRFRPRRSACGRAGSASPRHSGAARVCRRSTSTGSASSTSLRTATTACRWRARSAIDDINAYVTEVLTQVGAEREIKLSDLPLKSHERLFYERVPLPDEARKRIKLSDEWRYAALAEAVEAWGFRVSRTAAS